MEGQVRKIFDQTLPDDQSMLSQSSFSVLLYESFHQDICFYCGETRDPNKRKVLFFVT